MNVDEERLKKGLYWQRAWKLVEGCTKVSPGCENCWSETETVMRAGHPNAKINTRAGKVLDSLLADQFDGSITMREDNLNLPLRIKKPTVFAIWNDLFHEDVRSDFIREAYQVMSDCPQHTFLVLTKRAERMADFCQGKFGRPENESHIYHGVTICNQEEADHKIHYLLQVPGKRFLSIEPMLGSIDLKLNKWVCSSCLDWTDDVFLTEENYCECDVYEEERYKNTINQVLLGGESGKNARPMHPDWARTIRDQCKAAGVPLYLKQMIINGKMCKVPEIDGQQHKQLIWE